MTSMLHIFKKDLRRLRWAIGGWLCLVTVRLLADTLGADVALGGFALEFGIRQIVTLLSFLQLIVLAILIPVLVQDEPLVGSDAFWITRPMRPAALLAAKALFIVTFLIVVPLIAKIAVASAFDIGAAEITRLVPDFLVNQLFLVSVLMTLAVLTPSFARYAMAIVAIVGAFILIIGSQLIFVMLFATETDSGSERLPDPTAAIVAATGLIATAFAVIAHQYQRRWLKRALVLASAGTILSYAVLDWWPWSYASLQANEVAATPQDTGALSVVMNPAERRVTDSFPINRRTPRKKQIAVRTIVTGVPSEFRAHAVVPRSKLELADGVVVQTGTERPVTGMVVGNVIPSTHDASIESALGGARLLTNTTAPMSGQEFAQILEVEEDTYARHRNESGKLTANIDILFERPVVRATLPLLDESRVALKGTHFVIVRVVRRATGCTVFVRRSAVEPLFSPPFYRNFAFVLVNRTRGEAVWSDPQGAYEQFIFDVSTLHIGGRGFVLEQLTLEFPSRSFTSSVDLDESWISGAEFVILEIIPAGRIERTVTVDGFRMSP